MSLNFPLHISIPLDVKLSRTTRYQTQQDRDSACSPTACSPPTWISQRCQNPPRIRDQTKRKRDSKWCSWTPGRSAGLLNNLKKPRTTDTQRPINLNWRRDSRQWSQTPGRSAQLPSVGSTKNGSRKVASKQPRHPPWSSKLRIPNLWKNKTAYHSPPTTQEGHANDTPAPLLNPSFGSNG